MSTWKQIGVTIALHLGSWIVDGMTLELRAIDNLPEITDYTSDPVYDVYDPEPLEIVSIPEPPRPYARLLIRSLVRAQAWGSDGIFTYIGDDLAYLKPGHLLMLPAQQGLRYFRVSRNTSKTLFVVPADYEFRGQEHFEEEPILVHNWPTYQTRGTDGDKK
jgi:hypothetical protein